MTKKSQNNNLNFFNKVKKYPKNFFLVVLSILVLVFGVFAFYSFNNNQDNVA